MSARAALVTIAVGDYYEELWRRTCEANWRAYAERHGYDVICLTEPLDPSRRAADRSPSWQKLLILGQDFAADYERVVWVDADILFNPEAPGVADVVPAERVGATDEFATPDRETQNLTMRKLYAWWTATDLPFRHNLTPREYYAAWDLDTDHDAVVQAGLLVLSPRHHRELLERVYYEYEDKPGLNFEMRPLSYELLEAGVVDWIDPRFNYLWSTYKALHFPYLLNDPDHPQAAADATAALRDVFALHFAAGGDDIERVDLDLPIRRPIARPPRRVPGRIRAPVALSIFARPDTTARVLDVIRELRPDRLLVFADGPRPEVDGEAERCRRTRELLDRVDWPCELETNFSDANLGARRRIESGLDWVFDRADEAIILEDDCLPEPTFFNYADELLDRYRDEPRVFSIAADDFAPHDRDAKLSYRFSRYSLIWGWATWGRAWRRFDTTIARWPEQRADGWLLRLTGDPVAASYWAHLFDQVHAGGGSWDFAWQHACWTHGGLSAVPTTNLVSNLGFRSDATHTKIPGDARSPFASLPTVPMRFPLRHPDAVESDPQTDRFLENVLFSGNVRRTFALLRAAGRPRVARG